MQIFQSYNSQQIKKSVKSLIKLWKRQYKRLSLFKDSAMNIPEHLQITFNIK